MNAGKITSLHGFYGTLCVFDEFYDEIGVNGVFHSFILLQLFFLFHFINHERVFMFFVNLSNIW